MSQNFGFNATGVQRIVRSVQASERSGVANASDKSQRGLPTGAFSVSITGEDPANPGHYSWKLQTAINGVLQDTDPVIEDTNFTAQEANGLEGVPTGSQVRLNFVGYDATKSNAACYLFWASPLYHPLALNNTGSDIPPWGVAGVYGSPSSAWPSDPTKFGGQFILNTIGSVVTADYCGSFAIFPGGCKNGQSAPIAISGITQAMVNITNAGDKYCDVKDSDATQLLSRSSGSCFILSDESNGSRTGKLRCFISMGLDQPFWAIANSKTQFGSNFAWKYGFAEVTLHTPNVQNGWALLAGGRTGTTTTKMLLNTLEANNAASGLFGIGTNSSSLPPQSSTSIQLQPIPVGSTPTTQGVSPILLRKVVVGSTITYQVVHPNGLNGGCT
jgi:hypothetical protein